MSRDCSHRLQHGWILDATSGDLIGHHVEALRCALAGTLGGLCSDGPGEHGQKRNAPRHNYILHA